MHAAYFYNNSKHKYMMTWLCKNLRYHEMENVKNENKQLKKDNQKLILENETLKRKNLPIGIHETTTIVRNIETNKDETIIVKKRKAPENNNGWLSIASQSSENFKKIKSELQDKVEDIKDDYEISQNTLLQQATFTDSKLTEIDILNEQIKKLKKEKEEQEKLTSELLNKVKKLEGRE